jgi:hypothetical protein
MIVDEIKKWDGQLHMFNDKEKELFGEIRRVLVRSF